MNKRRKATLILVFVIIAATFITAAVFAWPWHSTDVPDSSSSSMSFTSSAVDPAPQPEQPGRFGADDAARLAAGRTSVYVVDTQGDVWGWGGHSSYYGQMGTPNGNVSSVPVHIRGIDNVQAASAGIYYAMMLRDDGVYGLGSNLLEGMLGIGNTEAYKDDPTPLALFGDVVAIESGLYHTLALVMDSDGSTSVWAWGGNFWGQVGNGTRDHALSPVKVDGLPANIMQISARNQQSMAITDDGDVYVWGGEDIRDGGARIVRTTPQKLEEISDVKEVSQGYNHTLFLKQDGSLWGMGSNSYGELGISMPTSIRVPTKIDIEVPVLSLGGCGEYMSSYIGIDHLVYTAGLNSTGQLGRSGGAFSASFEPVEGVSRAAVAKAGQSFMVVLSMDGELYTWGDNTYGQLGTGKRLEYSEAPLLVDRMSMEPAQPDYMPPPEAGRNAVELSQSQEILWNPYMGVAPNASRYEEHADWEDKPKLAHVMLYWKQIEPREGEIDFEWIERTFHFDEWRAAGATLIIRIACDNADMSDAPYGIPTWLYQKTGDGDHYSSGGYAPNYHNEVFLAAHDSLLRRMGERYNNDPLISMVQLGSLGKWGEWHGENFPDTTLARLYVEPYMRYWGNKQLQIRRPHILMWQDQWLEYPSWALRDGDLAMGLYNDVIGNPDSMESWNSWIQGGSYRYPVEGGIENYPAVPDFWLTQISGGEVSSVSGGKMPLEWFEDDNIEATLEQVRMTHITYARTSFLPELWSLPMYSQDNERVGGNIRQFLNTMGYRFWVSRVETDGEIARGTDTRIRLWWNNAGSAPFYYDGWQVEMALLTQDGTLAAKVASNADIKTWLPGENHGVDVVLPVPEGLAPGCYEIAVSICDEKGVAGPGSYIRIANEGTTREDGWHIITAVDIV